MHNDRSYRIHQLGFYLLLIAAFFKNPLRNSIKQGSSNSLCCLGIITVQLSMAIRAELGNVRGILVAAVCPFNPVSTI
jgi:hypothetical protein